MLVALPALCLFSILLLFRIRYTNTWRQAFLATALICGVATALGTELLSQLNLVTIPGVAALWVVILATSALMLRSALAHQRQTESASPDGLSRSSIILLACVAIYVLFIGVIAIVAPPNTWDSMEYHMPKVMHWIQHHNISFFPTAIPRQNHQSPGAELFILHLQVLSGSDRFANLVEWLSMVGSLAAITLIAKELGAGVRGQVLAAVFVVTMPMGIMQASSTQTDYVIAFWLSSMVYFMLRLIRAERLQWPNVLALSAALGLGVLTKATIYLYAFSFLVWMTLVLLRKFRGRALAPLAAIAVVVIVLNAGHWTRNYQLHGSPLGPGEEPLENTKYSNDTFVPQALISGAIRNVCTHLNTPWPDVNKAIENGAVALHKVIGWDANDRRTTWGPASFVKFSVRRTTFHDEVDGNPLHLILLFVCGVLLLTTAELRNRRTLLIYSACVLAAFLAFSCYIKWSPWNSRVHVSVFVLAGVIAGIVLEKRLNTLGTSAIAAVLLVLGLPWMLGCVQRPVLAKENIFNSPRDKTYFNEPHQNFANHYFAARSYLEGIRPGRVGLIVSNQSWEYVWWVFLRQLNPAVEIQHVNMTDPSRRFANQPPYRDFQPEVVISVDQEHPADSIVIGSVTYPKRWSQGNVVVYHQ